MRDVGLDEAIRGAGGIGALARKIGISQPSVSNWSRVPAERVLSVEAATGVSRAVLRPDLYAEHPGLCGDVDEVDAARAQEYALLSALASIAGRFLTGTTAGSLIEAMGYVNFYLLTTAIAVPGVILFWWMIRTGLVDQSLGSAGKTEGT